VGSVDVSEFWGGKIMASVLFLRLGHQVSRRAKWLRYPSVAMGHASLDPLLYSSPSVCTSGFIRAIHAEVTFGLERADGHLGSGAWFADKNLPVVC